MPSCPPLHIANPNVPQSLDDASVGPVTVTAGGDSELWVRGTGVVFTYFLKPVHCNVVVDPWGSLKQKNPERRRRLGSGSQAKAKLYELARERAGEDFEWATRAIGK